MKTFKRILLPALFAGLTLMLSGRVAAQTLSTVYTFAPGQSSHPTLILSGNTLYGMSQEGGSYNAGAVFAVNTDGTGYTNLHNFPPPDPDTGSNYDGSYPCGGVILSGGTLFGTASQGGSQGAGTIFALNTNGSNFTVVCNFTNTQYAYNLYTGVILSGNTLYGTGQVGGSNGYGSVFAVNTNGSNFITLHSFTTPEPNGANVDGANPLAGLILSGSTLYGTTSQGGGFAQGTVFAIGTNGSNFVTLHHFTADASPAYTNTDGAQPRARLVLLGNTLYGTAYTAGEFGSGTVFAVGTNSSNFTTLHNFTAIETTNYPYANSDGASPEGGLILSGANLYGTAFSGGANGSGTIFALTTNTNGSGFTNLYSFTSDASGNNSDGAYLQDALVLSSNVLYGTANQGGTNNYGTVFKLSFLPKLTIIPSGTNTVVTWPTNVVGFSYTGYTLQSTTNLAPPVVWSNVSGQFAVTNGIAGKRKFYRLSQ